MLTVYLCGALVTAMAVLGGAVKFSDRRSAAQPRTRVAVALLAGALWPIVAVGVLSLMAVVPLLEYLGTAPAKTLANKRYEDSVRGGPVLAGYRSAA